MKLIRLKSKLLIPAAAILLGGWALTSCSPESYVEEPSAPEGEDGAQYVKRYFSMRILTSDNEDVEGDDSNMDFRDGTDFEHRMDVSDRTESVVIFFYPDGKYYGYTAIDYDRLYSQGVPGNYPAEVSYIGEMHSPNPAELYALPEYGMMVLNAQNIKESLDALSLKEDATIRDVLRLVDDASDGSRRPGISANGYFTMSSTAYLEPSTGGWYHSVLFEIDKRKIYENRIQAAISPAATAIVERMASKFSLTMPGSVGGNSLNFVPNQGKEQVIVCNYTGDQPNYNNRSWTCTVDAWGINKYETQSYFFRNILGEGADVSSYPYTYGADINRTGQPFYKGWNRAPYHRAFWGIDPHYDEGIFPRQYRPAVDNPDLDFYGAKGTPSLGYVSYNELSSDFSKMNTPEGLNLYSSENTLPDTRIGGLWQHDLAASELVIGARLHIDRVNENRQDYDLFRNRIGIFYPSVADFATYFISTFNSQLESQSHMTYRYYDWEDLSNNTGTEMRDINLAHANYKLYYKGEKLTPERMAGLEDYLMPACIENGDGKVIPWIEGLFIGRREVDPETYEEYGSVQRLPLSDNELKSLIYDWAGPFDHFNQGRMVYSVPILHNASTEEVSKPTFRPAVGDYGVARNTWYSFSLQDINTLGNPVDDLNQKIIPYSINLENALLMEIKVLNWHEFDTTVVLPGSN